MAVGRVGGLGGGDVVHSTMGASSLLPAPEAPERNIMPVTLCDCERGHNGLGMVGRECDCMPPDPCALDGPPRTFPSDFELFPNTPHLNKDK